MYLDFAELQATNGRLMKMVDWIAKLDEFIKLSERRVLTNAGSVRAEDAAHKAEEEYNKFHQEHDKHYLSDFDLAVKQLKQKTAVRKKKKG